MWGTYSAPCKALPQLPAQMAAQRTPNSNKRPAHQPVRRHSPCLADNQHIHSRRIQTCRHHSPHQPHRPVRQPIPATIRRNPIRHLPMAKPTGDFIILSYRPVYLHHIPWLLRLVLRIRHRALRIFLKQITPAPYRSGGYFFQDPRSFATHTKKNKNK